MCENVYDMIIVGSGPAGLTAGVYGKRAGLKVVILESGFIQGGQIVNTYEVDNYPGLPGIGGLELAEKMKEHVTGLGVEIVRGKVKGISLDGVRCIGSWRFQGRKSCPGWEFLIVRPVTGLSLRIRRWLLSVAVMWLWRMRFSWREAVSRYI